MFLNKKKLMILIEIKFIIWIIWLRFSYIIVFVPAVDIKQF